MIRISNLDVVYGAGKTRNHVVKGVGFEVGRGQTLGIVGESGCGKSTVLRSLAGIEQGWTGSIELDGKAIGKIRSRNELKCAQMVFQDPYGSLHPRHRIGTALAEPLRSMGHGDGWSAVQKALRQVGLPESFANRFPHALPAV
ncbi:ATP-binding cassette domain-containing protein [Rhizobium sp. SEMIA 4085]|nr:ATP-binding cassette domain-containing protein [Rhizobium sp. SEMIA 4085]